MRKFAYILVLIISLFLILISLVFFADESLSSILGVFLLLIGALLVYAAIKNLKGSTKNSKGNFRKITKNVNLQIAQQIDNMIRSDENENIDVAPFLYDIADEQKKNETIAYALKLSVNQFLEDNLLSEDEEQKIDNFITKNNLSVDDINEYGAITDLAKAVILRKITEGKIPSSNEIPNFEMPIHFNFQKSESLIWAFSNVDYYKEVARRRYEGGHQGFSVRLAKGLYYRTGAFKGHPITEKNMEYQDTGILCLTTKHIYFGSYDNMFRIKYDKVVAFTPYDDGIGVMKDTQSAKPMVFRNGEGWFTYNLVINLSSEKSSK